MCHNCNVSTNFYRFLQSQDAELHKEYVYERYLDNRRDRLPSANVIVEAPESTAWKHFQTFADVKIPNISELPKEHYAREYIASRKIPITRWSEIFFVEDYKTFIDDFVPDHGRELVENDPRIVMFYTDIGGTITGVTGRSLRSGDKRLRYISIKISEDRKIFGTHLLDTDKIIYVTEGQFDSMFLPNAIASGDSALTAVTSHFPSAVMIFVYDREPRNKELVRTIERALDDMDNFQHGFCLLPDDFEYKDINEAIQKGIKPMEMMMIIEANTYYGLHAKLEFLKWKKC